VGGDLERATGSACAVCGPAKPWPAAASTMARAAMEGLMVVQPLTCCQGHSTGGHWSATLRLARGGGPHFCVFFFKKHPKGASKTPSAGLPLRVSAGGARPRPRWWLSYDPRNASWNGLDLAVRSLDTSCGERASMTSSCPLLQLHHPVPSLEGAVADGLAEALPALRRPGPNSACAAS